MTRQETPGQCGAVPETVMPAAEPPNDATAPVPFDRSGLLERLGGRSDMLNTFIGMFSANTSGFMIALRDALDRADFDQVRIQAHAIKGAASNISALRMQETAAAIEARAKKGSLDGVPELVGRLEDEFEEFGRESGNPAAGTEGIGARA